jgi:transcriptional regulator with XRE-family HTH domain
MTAPRDVIREQLVAIRKRRGWTQAQLAQRLKELGYPHLGRAGLSKIELGARSVTVDDLLALAAALDVAPVHLFVPYERDRRVDITSDVGVSAATTRRWVHGWEPLPGSDEKQYFSEMAPDEWWVQRNGHVRAIASLFEQYARPDVPEENREDAEELANRLASDVMLMVRKYKAELAELQGVK